jgi:hypothetical protein
MTTEESAELKRLKRENAELKRANAILRSASVFFAAELDRPHSADRGATSTSTSVSATMATVCDGVSSRSATSSPSSVAKIAPATYYEHRGRKATVREQRDEDLKPRIAAVHASNYGVYGARKVWLTLNRERPVEAAADRALHRGTTHGRARPGRRGAGKVKKTTISDPKAPKPLDLVTATSRPWHQTGSGWPTSPTARRGRAGATPRSSSTPTPGGSWAGRWPPR